MAGSDARTTSVPQPIENPRQIADAVTGGVGETARVDLVHDRVLPPRTITPVSAYIVVRCHGISPGSQGWVVGCVR